MEYYCNYPDKPIGGGNPYNCCSSCGISTPEINGRLDGHAEDCAWRIDQENKLKDKDIKPVKVIINETIEKIITEAHMAGQSDAGVDPSYSNAVAYCKLCFDT